MIWCNCPRTTSSSILSRLFRKKERDKVEVSTWSGGCVRPWLTRDIVKESSFRRGWARFRRDWRSGTINGALSTPVYHLALLRDLSHVLRVLEIAEAKQVRKTNQTGILYQIKKKGPKIHPHVSNAGSCWFRFRGILIRFFSCLIVNSSQS